MIIISKKYTENVNYHAHRKHRFTKATKEQKEFSDGYLGFAALVTMDDPDITIKDKNDYLSKQMNIAKDPKNPNRDRAKGFIASMFDFKKHIPKEVTIWGNPKTKK